VSPRSVPEKTDNPFAAAARALFAPWSFAGDAPRTSASSAIVLSVLFVAVAAALSVLLSTWTYLIGKGLLMAAVEMDMGMDDLPPDSVRQVASSFVLSFGIWAGLLGLLIAIAVAVADVIYRNDRRGFALAVRRVAAATIWFVVWAVAVLAVNSLRYGELSHPAAAVRAYAQNNQHWFTGSSAFAPGPVRPEPLAARGRFLPLVLLFPLVWSVSVPAPAGGRNRMLTVVAVCVLSWLAWWGLWRLLPWITLETLAG
jgi:hypothetical protein